MSYAGTGSFVKNSGTALVTSFSLTTSAASGRFVIIEVINWGGTAAATALTSNGPGSSS